MEDKLPKEIVEEHATTFTLEEFCELCGVDINCIIEMVQVGILTPAAGARKSSWQFSVFQLQRVKKANRLQNDLKLNMEGVALSLELLDQIGSLRRQLESLQHQLALLNYLDNDYHNT